MLDTWQSQRRPHRWWDVFLHAAVRQVPVWVVVVAAVVAASAAFSFGLLVSRDDKPSTPAPAPATYFGGHGDSYFGKP